MGRSPRIAGTDLTYHVTARGNGQTPIFRDRDDRRVFMDRLNICMTRREWIGWSYCLMGNHVHLCVTTPEGDISTGMRDLLGWYARYFNWRHGGRDHLFGQRFGSVLVTTDAQLLSVVRYIALNPVRAGLVGGPTEWEWSSYPGLVGDREPEPWLDSARLLAMFHRRPRHALLLLRQFVASPDADDELPIQARDPRRSLWQIFAALDREQAIRASLEAGYSLPDIQHLVPYNYSTLWRRYRSLQADR